MRTPEEPSTGLIRTFSDELREIDSTDALGRGLAAKLAHDRHREEFLIQEWDILLSDARQVPEGLVQGENMVLLDQSRRLYAAWDKFRKSLSQQQKVEANFARRPDIKYLLETVSRAASTWREDRERSKTGRLKEKFFKLCDNCNNHSILLAVIPSHDKYISLLTGSLSAIAQASINHQHIAEGVLDGLEELSKDIEFWNRQMEEHGNIKMLRQHIQELYVVVFEVFTDIFTSWSKSSGKRFFTSFDESAFTRLFIKRRERIEAIERYIKREITLEFQRTTRSSIEKLASNQEKLLELFPQHFEEQRYLLGAAVQKFLEEQWQSPQPLPGPLATLVLDSGAQSPKSLAAEPDVIPEDDHSSPIMLHNYDRAEVSSAVSVYLDQFKVEMNELVELISSAPPLQIDRQVHQKLNVWIQEFSSTNLWIQGPYGVAKPSQNTMTAVSIVALAHNNKLPTICYFCSLNDDIHPHPTRHHALRAMLASIIAQLVLFLPERGSTSADLSPDRFLSITQKTTSIEDLLRLIRDLRRAGPRYLHCVIDSLHLLEDRSDPGFTDDLLVTVAMLSSLSCDGASRNRDNDNEGLEDRTLYTKAFFTTDGVMDGLSQAAEIDLVQKIEFDVEVGDGIGEDSTYMMV